MSLIGEIQNLVHNKQTLSKETLSYYENRVVEYIEEMRNQYNQTKENYLMNRIRKIIYWFNELKKL